MTQEQGTHPPSAFSAEAREVALEELKFHHERQAAGSEIVTTIGQNIFILIGAGLVAATQVPEAIAFVPLFWSAWMLHSLQRSRDSIKHQVYARALEARINASLGQPVLVWNRALTAGSLTPAVTAGNYVYWVILNLASWVVGVVVLFSQEWPLLAWLLSATGLGVYALTVVTLVTSRKFETRCQTAVDLALADPSSYSRRYERWGRPPRQS